MVYDLSSIDSIILLAGFIPGTLSLLSAAFSTETFVLSNFIRPATRHVESLHQGYKTSKVNCDNCVRDFGKYFQMSITRFGLSNYLSFISVGLFSQSLIFLVRGQFLVGLSFVSYFVVLLIFNLYSVVINKEIFSWWESPIFKLPLLAALMSITVFASVQPVYVSFFDYFLNGSFFVGSPIPIGYIQIGLALFVLLFLLNRALEHTLLPSLRNVLLDSANRYPEGLTIDNWYIEVNACMFAHISKIEEKFHRVFGSKLDRILKTIFGSNSQIIWSKVAVENEIKKLIYQEILIPKKHNGPGLLLGPNTFYKKSS
jgi:hypothetical protein